MFRRVMDAIDRGIVKVEVGIIYGRVEVRTIHMPGPRVAVFVYPRTRLHFILWFIMHPVLWHLGIVTRWVAHVDHRTDEDTFDRYAFSFPRAWAVSAPMLPVDDAKSYVAFLWSAGVRTNIRVSGQPLRRYVEDMRCHGGPKVHVPVGSTDWERFLEEYDQAWARRMIDRYG